MRLVKSTLPPFPCPFSDTPHAKLRNLHRSPERSLPFNSAEHQLYPLTTHSFPGVFLLPIYTNQVVNLKKMASANAGSDRWRLVLSDGRHYAQSMLATQQNGMITSGELQELSIITLTDYIVNSVQNKRRGFT